MRLEDQSESSSVEDRRGGGGFGIGAGGAGIGTVVIALVASYFFGIDPRVILGLGESMQGSQQGQHPIDPAKDPEAAMVSEVKKILAKTEDTWEALFKEAGGQYRRPALVLYRNVTPTACGSGQAAAGPFYCPGDEKIYLDLSFFDQMARRFRAGGDFARAYVIAHEVGHHVQRQLGVTAKTDALRQKLSSSEYNKVSVRVELQADCFAGVWAQHANRAHPFLDPGDVEEALAAANAIGDDALQKQSRGVVVPDSFTHGSSAQRMRWFRTGFDSGNLRSCDTFSAAAL
jgi:predicted metalloprotease